MDINDWVYIVIIFGICIISGIIISIYIDKIKQRITFTDL